MKTWVEMSASEKSAAVIRLVRKQGLSYAQAARELGVTRNAVAGALGRAEGRETNKVRKARPVSQAGRKIGQRQHDKHQWSEENLSEPWAVWSARRKAERLAASKGKA